MSVGAAGAPPPAGRPLAGRSVVVTRPREQAAALAASLEALGAEVLVVPTIRIEPRPFDNEVAAAIHRLPEYRLLVLTSANAVRVFAGYLVQAPAGRLPHGLVVAAVGPATAEALARHGLPCHIIPGTYVAEGLIEALAGADVATAGARVLIPGARAARDVLPAALRAQGAVVDVLPIYDTLAAEGLAVPAERLEAADYITFTSASTAKQLAALLAAQAAESRPLAERLAGVRLCSIGPLTSAALRGLGLTVAVEARESTADGLVAAVAADAVA